MVTSLCTVAPSPQNKSGKEYLWVVIDNIYCVQRPHDFFWNLPYETANVTFHHASTGFPVKWCLRNKCRNSILMKHHYTSDWMKQFSTNQKHYSDLGNYTADQYGISALVSQMSFCRETSEGIAKCWLFSEAILEGMERGTWFAITSDYYIIEKASFHWLSFSWIWLLWRKSS